MLRRLGFGGSARQNVVCRRLVLVIFFTAVLVLPNLMAYFHARAMTKFAQAGARTDAPENLTLADKAWIVSTGVTLPRPANKRTPHDVDVGYETHIVRSSGAPALEVWRIPGSNSRPVVVMFHGYGSCKSEMLS